MYGEKPEWGCKWFQLWREHIKTAVARNQRLQVFYQAHHVGKGKIQSTSTMTAWELCSKDAARRGKLARKRQYFLQTLPPQEQARLEELSTKPRDDARGEMPGSVRGDEEERMFMLALSEDERSFCKGHKGLGNSQKAEVAWLEKVGCEYDEVDVRDFLDAHDFTLRNAAE
jgi:hypothetical protein